MRHPRPEEYAGYYAQYVDRTPPGDVLEQLATQLDDTAAILADLGEERARYRYAPGKWSVNEVIGHITDCERVFAYRALRLARGDETPLPGFEQDPYVEGASFDARSMADLLDELRAVRAASLTLFRSFAPGVEDRVGTISGLPFVVCTIPWLIAGHELHHADVLRARYLPAGS